MIRFKDNPNLEHRKVKTVRGLTEYRQNCRNIRDKWYIKDEDCFYINGKWHTFTSKEVTLDHETGKYVPLDKKLVYGVVGFKESDTSAIFGYFTENMYNNLTVNLQEYGKVKTVNEAVLLQNGFVESINNGAWLLKKNLSARELEKLDKIESQKVATNKGYNIEDNKVEFKQKIDAFNNYPIKISAAAMRYAKMLGATSFGAEIETAKGIVPDHIQNRTGIVVCRDGSIKNAEYVTVPMAGAKGLINLKYLASELSKRTTTDISCSLHFHLGNLPKDRLFIVALYALALRIQDEIFTMFPYYKTKSDGVKKQDYNKKLKRLGTGILKKDGMNKEAYQKWVDEGYYRIFTWLNDGVPPDDNFNRVNNHHMQKNKWDRKQRYYWLNFMNMFFSERRTMEFRLHHNTLNGQKMVNWLFICNAICQYAAKNADVILSDVKPISLDAVLDYYKDTFKTEHGTFLSNYLKAYVADRKAYFKRDFDRGDYISQKETDDDKKYVFTYEGKSWLF
jgi:hypothetical protein